MLGFSGGEPENGLSVWRLNQVASIIQERFQELSEEGREIPLVWSMLHMSTTMQLGKVIAMRRGLDPELAGLVCIFHDIHSSLTGKYEKHAQRAEPYIREIIAEYNRHWGNQLGEITEEEVEIIIDSISIHSNKLAVTDDAYAELLKDVDSFDAYLHGFEPTDKSGRRSRVVRVFKELTLEVPETL